MTGETTDIVAPIIHLNGTSAERLKEALEETYLKLSEAVEALRQGCPNGRDYYPQPGLMKQAEEQHYRRIKVLRDLQAELEKECELIDAQSR